MRRNDIVRIFKETAALLELEGVNVFRIRAYENAARTFEGLADEPEELLERNQLAEAAGIGPALALAAAEIIQTGRLGQHEELKGRHPPGVLDLFRVGGLGPKRIRVLYRELGVASLADLERACADGRVAALAGFGARSQETILAATRQLASYSERHLLSEARRMAADLAAYLESCAAIGQVAIAGSLRRWRETIGNLDLVAVVAPERRPEVADHLAAFSPVQAVDVRSEACVAVRLATGLDAELRLVSAGEFALALQQLTGSEEHNRGLAQRAVERGFEISGYRLMRKGTREPVASEADLYRRLGLDWIPAELREGLGEIELAATGSLPGLIEPKDLQGTFHVHTSWSDGTASVEQMAAAAGARGWSYLGIADHSPAAAYAGGLGVERLHEQWREIDAWNAAERSPRLFKGTEVDILSDGALDYPDEILLGFDYVVASIHSRFQLPAAEMTARLVRAVSHPAVTFLGHPTGRLLLAREGYVFDLETVLAAAAENGVIVEVNASPYRLDLDWRDLRGWLARGCRTSIHPDAHSPQGLADVEFGVGIARKAGARASDVLNCLAVDEVDRFFAQRRARARAQLGVDP